MPLTPQIPPASYPTGLMNNNFSTVGGAIAGQPVMLTLYDLAPWNQLRAVFQRHPHRKPSFAQMLKAMGGPLNRGVAAPTTGHYEKDWDRSLVDIATITTPSGGAGQAMVVTLSAGSMFNTSVTVGGAARQGSYPQPNEIIQLPTDEQAYIVSKDVSVTPHRLTLKPVNAAINLNAHVTAGEAYFITSNAWGEATKLPQGVMSRLYEYSNTFQIVKDAWGASGSAMTVDIYPQLFQLEDGNIWAQLKMDTVDRFERKRSGALLWGQQINNWVETDTALGYDVAVTGTEGLIPFALANGHIDTYTPGSFTVAEFYQIARIFHQEGLGTPNVMALLGYDLYAEVEQALATLFAQTLQPQMISSFINGSGAGVLDDGWQPANDSDFVAWLSFKGVHVMGVNFLFKVINEFSEAIGAGADAYDYPQWGIYMPLGTTKDMGTGEVRNRFGYEWRQLGRYSREAVVGVVAGVGVAGAGGYLPMDMVSSEYDFAKGGMVSEIAFHAAGGNGIVIQRPT